MPALQTTKRRPLRLLANLEFFSKTKERHKAAATGRPALTHLVGIAHGIAMLAPAGALAYRKDNERRGCSARNDASQKLSIFVAFHI